MLVLIQWFIFIINSVFLTGHVRCQTSDRPAQPTRPSLVYIYIYFYKPQINLHIRNISHCLCRYILLTFQCDTYFVDFFIYASLSYRHISWMDCGRRIYSQDSYLKLKAVAARVVVPWIYSFWIYQRRTCINFPSFSNIDIIFCMSLIRLWNIFSYHYELKTKVAYRTYTAGRMWLS